MGCAALIGSTASCVPQHSLILVARATQALPAKELFSSLKSLEDAYALIVLGFYISIFVIKD